MSCCSTRGFGQATRTGVAPTSSPERTPVRIAVAPPSVAAVAKSPTSSTAPPGGVPAWVSGGLNNLRNSLLNFGATDPAGTCGMLPKGKPCAVAYVRNAGSQWRSQLRNHFSMLKVAGYQGQADQLAQDLQGMLVTEIGLAIAEANQAVWSDYAGVYGHFPPPPVAPSSSPTIPSRPAGTVTELTAKPSLFAQFTQGRTVPGVSIPGGALPGTIPSPSKPLVPPMPLPGTPPWLNGGAAAPAPNGAAVQPAVTAMSLQNEIVTKQWQGYSYRVLTANGASMLLSKIAQSQSHSGALPIPSGTTYMSLPLPTESVYVVSAPGSQGASPSAENLINWMQVRGQEGLGLIIISEGASGTFQSPSPIPDTVKGFVVATRNIKLASDWTMGDEDSLVLLEPTAGWVLPDSGDAKAEVGGKSDYVLYVGAGIAIVAVIGLGYLAISKK